MDSILLEGIFLMETEEARYEFGAKNKKIFITTVPEGFKIFNENRLFLFRRKDKVIFSPKYAQSNFIIDNKSYSGFLKIQMADSVNLYLINEIDVESYLTGVIPAEIFTNQDILMEAVKAQAVCARSYTLKKMEVNSGKVFDVYSDVRDQVYGGKSIRTPLGDKAVMETRGSILMFGQEMADTYYHASCGGVLESAENVWDGEEVLYLRSRQDVSGKQFADIESPYYRWTEKRSPLQLDSLYQHNFGISHLKDMTEDTMDIPITLKVSERYSSGRVKNMFVQYGTDRRELSNYEIRNFLGWPPGKLLPSTLIKFSKNGPDLVINGAGNGHGVGMCQFGAMFKAKKGLQYYHILQSYFPGTILKKIY